MPRRAHIAASLILSHGLCLPSAAQTPLFAGGGDADILEGLQGAFSCPTDRLIDLYAGLGPAETLEILAVESEVLLICAERQEKLQLIADNESELRDALGIAPPGPGAARVSITGADLAAGVTQVSSCQPPAGEPQAIQEPPAAAAAVDDPAALPPPPERFARGAAAELGLSGRPAGRIGRIRAAVGMALARLEPRAAEESEGGGGCGGWSWVWTAKDFTGARSALLLAAAGETREVSEDDGLPGGLTVTAIGNDGVSVRDQAGRVTRLPRAAAAVTAETEVRIPAEIEARVREIRGGGG